MSEEDILYNERGIKICHTPHAIMATYPRCKPNYIIEIKDSGENHFLREQLERLAMASKLDLEKELNMINPGILRKAKEHQISLESIGLAMAQTYIKELEKKPIVL